MTTIRQAASIVLLEQPPRFRRGPRARRATSSVVTRRQVDRRVIAKALQLADGDAGRLQIEPDGSVYVLNSRRV